MARAHQVIYGDNQIEIFSMLWDVAGRNKGGANQPDRAK